MAKQFLDAEQQEMTLMAVERMSPEEARAHYVHAEQSGLKLEEQLSASLLKKAYKTIPQASMWQPCRVERQPQLELVHSVRTR